MLTDAFELLVSELNLQLQDIEDGLNKVPDISSSDGTTLSFSGSRITGLAESQEPTDAVTRQEILDLGLPIGRPTRTWRPSGPIFATRAIHVQRAIDPSDAVPLWQVQSLIQTDNTSGGGSLSTIRDGEVIETQLRDGTRGSTKGILLFAAAEEDDTRARLVRATRRGVVTDDSEQLELLAAILDRLDRLIELNTKELVK